MGGMQRNPSKADRRTRQAITGLPPIRCHCERMARSFVGWEERSETHQKLSTERCPSTRQAFTVCGNMTSKQSVHRPVAGKVLHQLCGTPKTPCAGRTPEIGRAACRERVGQYVESSVGAES